MNFLPLKANVDYKLANGKKATGLNTLKHDKLIEVQIDGLVFTYNKTNGQHIYCNQPNICSLWDSQLDYLDLLIKKVYEGEKAYKTILDQHRDKVDFVWEQTGKQVIDLESLDTVVVSRKLTSKNLGEWQGLTVSIPDLQEQSNIVKVGCKSFNIIDLRETLKLILKGFSSQKSHISSSIKFELTRTNVILEDGTQYTYESLEKLLEILK